jgi:hypothetical protein
VCRIRETASLIFVPPGRASSSGPTRKPHSACRDTRLGALHAPHEMDGGVYEEVVVPGYRADRAAAGGPITRYCLLV